MTTPAPRKHPNRPVRVARVVKQERGSSARLEISPVQELRGKLKLPRALFARLMGCSDRTLANWELGRQLPEIYQSRLNELQRLYKELSERVKPNTIGTWLTKPHDEFDGLKPLEVIERGETYRIWRMIFLPKSGVTL